MVSENVKHPALAKATHPTSKRPRTAFVAVLPVFLLLILLALWVQGGPRDASALQLQDRKPDVHPSLSPQELSMGLTSVRKKKLQAHPEGSEEGVDAGRALQNREASRSSRSLVFDSAWGRDALGKLQEWRSTLFLRMAERYTREEREQTNGGKEIKRVEPRRWGRYDVAQPYLGCPSGDMERMGSARDGGKWLCREGLLNRPGCIIYSLGSNGQFGFERSMLNNTACEIHTLDCTFDGASVDGDQRHFYHKICMGRTSKTIRDAGEEFEYLDWKGLLERLKHSGRTITLLKIDIEGYEFDVLSGWREQEGCSLPVQVAMEIHYSRIYNLMRGKKGARVKDDDFSNLYWPRHQVSLGEMATWFGHLANLGYAVISREDNPGGSDCCSEFTLLKVEQPAGCNVYEFEGAATVTPE